MKEQQPKGIEEWYPDEKPYYMKTAYGEVSHDEWVKANEKWKEKQLTAQKSQEQDLPSHSE